MDALCNKLCADVAAAVEEFVDRLSVKFQLDKAELLEVWNDATDEKVKVLEPKKAPPKPKKPAKKVATDGKPTCIYEYQKNRPPGTLCGKRVCEESKTGGYCKAHLKYEGKTPKEKKPAGKKAAGTKKADAKELEIKVIETLQERTSPMVSVQINDWKQYVHEGTDLVFDHTAKEVIGRADGKGGVIALTVDDITIAKANGFKYRMPSKLTSATENAEEEEEAELPDSDVEEAYEDEEED